MFNQNKMIMSIFDKMNVVEITPMIEDNIVKCLFDNGKCVKSGYDGYVGYILFEPCEVTFTIENTFTIKLLSEVQDRERVFSKAQLRLQEKKDGSWFLEFKHRVFHKTATCTFYSN